MFSTTVSAAVLASALSIANPTQAAQEDAPRGPALDKIEATLREAGFESWGGIGREDGGHWEIDDAVHGDGHAYDVTVDRESYDILSRKRDE